MGFLIFNTFALAKANRSEALGTLRSAVNNKPHQKNKKNRKVDIKHQIIKNPKDCDYSIFNKMAFLILKLFGI